jgi:hypothetical protein
MRIRKPYALALALAAAGAVAVSGIALAAPTSDFSFEAIPNKAPKKEFKAGALKTSLKTRYTDPGNLNPGGAVERTQIYLDKNFKVNPEAAAKCSPSKIQGNIDMAAAMAACKRARVGKGIAQATVAGEYEVPACVLLFNGTKKNRKPTLLVFTRVQVAPPPANQIDCSDPPSNHDGNTTVLLQGVYKKASGKFGKVLDVNHITSVAALPLTLYKTKVRKGSYASARCASKSHKWHMKVVWTYNDQTKHTERKTQRCKVER